MNIKLCFTDGVLNLPSAAVSHLAEASANALRVLVSLGVNREITVESLVEISGLSEKNVKEALSFWAECGVVSIFETAENEKTEAVKEPDFRYAFTGEEMKRIAENSDIGELIDVCSAILGKTFTAKETEAIYYLYDSLHLDFQYIVMLCKFCHDMGKPSIRYIEKVGMRLYDEGTVTVGALESYIKNEERKGDMEYKIRTLFGLGERALTPKENEYLSCWVLEWNLPYEVLELAYNQMMASIDKPKFSYANGILKKWMEMGLRTKEDVEAFLSSPKHKKTKTQTKEKSAGFDLDEFFNAATLRGDASSEPADGE